MAQKNRKYWEERQIKRESKAFSKIQDVEKEYKIALEKAKRNLTKEISRIGTTYVLDRPWSGANFSERIWGNTDKLAQVVKQEIVNGMIQGINLQTMNKRVSERFEIAKKNDVERLLRTEVNYT